MGEARYEVELIEAPPRESLRGDCGAAPMARQGRAHRRLLVRIRGMKNDGVGTGRGPSEDMVHGDEETGGEVTKNKNKPLKQRVASGMMGNFHQLHEIKVFIAPVGMLHGFYESRS